jgi:hypothetical protein
MRFSPKGLSACAAIGALSISLSGCIVVAIPLLMAAGVGAVAVTGFVVYKSVQTTSGGTVRIAFGSTDAKNATPPQPLPPSPAIAVWSNGALERKFADTLKASGGFRVVQADAGAIPVASDERAKGYVGICRAQKVNTVMAAVDDGQTVNSNMLSFKRGALTHKLTLEGFGCAEQKLIWLDTMAVVVESGGKPTPQSEIDDIAGQAWGERVVAASKAGH